MKAQTIIMLVFCMSLSFVAETQTQRKFIEDDSTRNEISAGFGVLTTLDMALSLGYLISLPMAWGTDVYRPHYTGALFLGYQNRVSKRVKLSATFAYERIRLESINTTDSKRGNSYSVLGGVKFKYNKTESSIDLYSRLDVGIMVLENRQNGANKPDGENIGSTFAFQVSPICIRFGRKIGGFFEFGFGNLGLINFGINFRF